MKQGNLQRINDAIKNGIGIEVIYHGGSQPGTIRAIMPLRIEGNKLKARCIVSSEDKTYLLDKIEIPNDEHEVIDAYDALRNNFKTIGDTKRWYDKKLEGLNWYISYKADEHISLHRKSKNGKIFKVAYVSLRYDQMEKPWIVTVKNERARRFKIFKEAANYFMQQSEAKAPK